VSKAVTIIAVVSDYSCWPIICKKRLCLPVVGLLANGKYQPTVIAQCIAAGVYLGAKTIPAAT